MLNTYTFGVSICYFWGWWFGSFSRSSHLLHQPFMAQEPVKTLATVVGEVRTL